MKLEKLDDLAPTLYAFADPDSELYTLNVGDEDFKQELQAHKQLYEDLNHKRMVGLRLAVVWLLSENIKKDDKDLEQKLKTLIPKFYKRIWYHLNAESEKKDTEESIKELDTPRYVAAMKYILEQAA
jgi:hypothetical protein